MDASARRYSIGHEDTSHWMPSAAADGRHVTWYVFDAEGRHALTGEKQPTPVFSGTKAECEAWLADRAAEAARPESPALRRLLDGYDDAIWED
jgi:hypothetical protein